MPIAFPSSPTQGQTTVTGGRTWTWDGVSWAAVSTVDLIAVSSNVTPVSTLAYDLGSSSLRWRDLYMSGNTIDLGGTAIKSSANGVSFTSAANAAAAVPLTVSSLQIASATGNVVTLQATATGLQTVATSGNVVATTPGGSSGHVQYNLAGAFAGSANLTFDGTNLNVGSGTVSTTRTLNVLGSQSIERYGATPQLAIRGGTDSTTGKDLRFNLTQTYLTIGAATIGGTQNNWLTFDFSNPSMNFALDGTEGMRLTSTGLGIGTSSPVYRLDVAGGVARIQNSGANAELLLTDSGTTNGAVRVRGVSNQLQIVSGGGTTATFDSSGNLGLGVTPSAWASPFIALESGSVSNQWQSSVGFQTNNSVVSLNTNTFYNGSNYIYKYSKAASRFIVNSNSFEWQLAPSGTAGNAITFTQPMTLDSSGRLGIGTTSPSVKLHVAGSSIIANNTSINPDSYTNQTVAGAISFTTWGVSSAIGGNAGTGDSWAIGHNGSNLYFGMEDGSAADSMQTYMRFAPDRNLFLVESSGSVCIGTSTYSGSKMEVVGGTGIYRVLKLRSGESTAANNAGIEFYTTSGATASNRSMEMVLDADGANSAGMDYFIIRKRGNSGDAELWQVSNANLLFSTNDIERVRISNNGYVGIGTTLPKAYLHSKAGVIAFNGMGSNTSVTYDNYWTAFASSGAAGTFSGVLTITIPDVNGGANSYGYGSWSAEVYLSGYSGVFCHWYISGYTNTFIQIAENAFRNSSGGFSGSWALNGAQGITLTLDYPSITHPTVYLRINKGGDSSGGIWTDFSAIRITWS